MIALKRLIDPLRPRLKPSFLIIGAQKAGTSALFKMLARHPQVIAPEVKELHFFDDDDRYAKGITSYWRQFPTVPFREGERFTFEATPAYLFSGNSAERIHRHLPAARLVAVLRDPVKRAYSAWNMFRDFKGHPVHGHLHDARSFAQAVEEEIAGKDVRWEHRYLARGHYAGQLQRYFALFDRDRFTIIDYADLKNDPAKVLAHVLARVGLPPHHFDDAALRVKDNVRAYVEPLDGTLAAELYTYFAPHRQALIDLLGSAWALDERKD